MTDPLPSIEARLEAGNITPKDIRYLLDWTEHQKFQLDWWRTFRERGQERPQDQEERHGCSGCKATQRPDGGYDWEINPDCEYHAQAARYPSDHSIPWNCPTFWDGCNCTEQFRELLEAVKRQARIINAATDERFDVAAALVRANDDCERLEGEVERLREKLDLA